MSNKVFYEGLIDKAATPGNSQASVYNASGQIMPLQKYYNDMVQYIAPDQIISNCAEISFFNQGASNMVINGIVFAPNTGISLDGNSGELDVTKYNLGFSGAGQNLAFVVRKCYQDGN